MNQVDLHIEGMTCAACSARIEKVLNRIAGVEAHVSLIEHRARVTGMTTDDAIAAIRRAGYDAWPVQSRQIVIETTSSADRFRLGMSIVAAALMSLEMMAMLAGGPHILPLVIQFAIAALMQTVVAWPFYLGALRALRSGAANMESLVSLGTLAAFFWSVSIWLDSHAPFSVAGAPDHGTAPAVYFETSVVVLAMVCIGRHLELKARGRALAAIAALVRIEDAPVRMWRDDLAQFVRTDVARITRGARLEILPGDAISVDAIIIEGQSEIDESSMTGESVPALRRIGETIYAGCQNLSGRLVVDVICGQQESRRARIGSKILDALGTRAPIAALADRIAAVFVPAVLAISAATLAGHVLAGADIAASLGHAVAVLVVACPCALGLATPAAIAAGLARAAQRGWLFRSAEALQRAASLDMVVFDKTGTLTSGRPVVIALSAGQDRSVDISSTSDERPWPDWLAAAAAAEKGIEHPLAGALLAYAAGRPMPTLENAEVRPGQGVIATPGPVIVGRSSWVREQLTGIPDTDLADARWNALDGQHPDASSVDVAIGGQWKGRIWIADSLRPDAQEAIRVLNAEQIDVLILSGDRESAVRRVASQLGQLPFESAQSPEAKAARLDNLRREGRKVAMVGDGINDASAMAHAHLGIAMASGSAMALETADLTISSNAPLQASIQSILLARSTMARVKENLAFAFSFNLLAIPIAALGKLSPTVAGVAMALSSFLVVSNAARMLNWKPRP